MTKKITIERVTNGYILEAAGLTPNSTQRYWIAHSLEDVVKIMDVVLNEEDDPDFQEVEP